MLEINSQIFSVMGKIRNLNKIISVVGALIFGNYLGFWILNLTLTGSGITKTHWIAYPSRMLGE